MSYLYGKDKGDIFLKNYQALKEVTHAYNGVTNLGASIVPTSVNYDELLSIINCSTLFAILSGCPEHIFIIRLTCFCMRVSETISQKAHNPKMSN